MHELIKIMKNFTVNQQRDIWAVIENSLNLPKMSSTQHHQLWYSGEMARWFADHLGCTTP